MSDRIRFRILDNSFAVNIIWIQNTDFMNAVDKVINFK